MKRIILFLLFFTVLYAEKNCTISIKTAVKFNTVCAKCHEGECSGRLSFSSGIKAASSHICRYTDISSDDEAKEFFTILEHMKIKCSIYFPDSKLKKRKNWSKKDILCYSIPSKKSYFIPLGRLKEDSYSLKIKTENFKPYKIEIISENFEIALDRYISSSSREKVMAYTVTDIDTYYLRITGQKRLDIAAIESKILNAD